MAKKLCTGICYRKQRINVKSCFYYHINQVCRAAYEHFADFLPAFSSCTNCRNYFKLCSEAVSYLLAKPSSLGDDASGKRVTPTIAFITLNIGVLSSAGDAGKYMHKNICTVQEMTGHGIQCYGLADIVVISQGQTPQSQRSFPC